MPSGMAAEMRAALPSFDRTGLVLQRSTKSLTGFVNVIEVKGKFQARLQVPLAMVVAAKRSGSRFRCQEFLTRLRMPLFIWRRSRRACKKLVYPPPKLLTSWSLRTKITSPASRSSQLCRQRCQCSLWSHHALWWNPVPHGSWRRSWQPHRF